MEEMTPFIKRLEDTKGKAFDPSYAVISAVANVIVNVVYGSRYDYADPVFTKFISITQQSFEILGNSGALTVFPFLKHVPGMRVFFKYTWLQDSIVWIRREDSLQIQKHRDTMTPGVVRDIIDAFLVEMEKQKDNKFSTFTGG